MALAVTLQTVQVMATTYEECTAKTEMVLSVYSFERYSKTHTHTHTHTYLIFDVNFNSLRNIVGIHLIRSEWFQ